MMYSAPSAHSTDLHFDRTENLPLVQTPNLFHIWLDWLRSLGGTYEPMRDLDEKKPLSGRRDPDKKPRTYPVGYNKTFYPTRTQQQEKVAA